MKWTEAKNGYVTEDGYVIEGKPEQEMKMKLFHSGDMTNPLVLGDELTHLQLIAEGHKMATSITAFSDQMPAEMKANARVRDETRLKMSLDAARDFLGLYPKTKDV